MYDNECFLMLDDDLFCIDDEDDDLIYELLEDVKNGICILQPESGTQ